MADTDAPPEYRDAALDALARLQAGFSEDDLQRPLEIILESEEKRNSVYPPHPNDGFWCYHNLKIIDQDTKKEKTVTVAQTFYHKMSGMPHPSVHPQGDIEALHAINACLKYIGTLDFDGHDIVKAKNFKMFSHQGLETGMPICDATSILTWHAELYSSCANLLPDIQITAPGTDTIQ